MLSLYWPDLNIWLCQGMLSRCDLWYAVSSWTDLTFFFIMVFCYNLYAFSIMTLLLHTTVSGNAVTICFLLSLWFLYTDLTVSGYAKLLYAVWYLYDVLILTWSLHLTVSGYAVTICSVISLCCLITALCRGLWPVLSFTIDIFLSSCSWTVVRSPWCTACIRLVILDWNFTYYTVYSLDINMYH